MVGFVCRSKKIKNQIFLTKKVNDFNAYMVQLFCNGEPSKIIVDDLVPTFKSRIKYFTIENGS